MLSIAVWQTSTAASVAKNFHRHLRRHAPAGIERGEGAQRQEPRRIELCRRLGESGLDGLELRQRTAEGEAVLGIGDRRLKRRPRQPDRLQRDKGARGFDTAVELLGALPRLAQQVLLRDGDAIEAELGEGDRIEADRLELAALPGRLRALQHEAARARLAALAFSGHYEERDEIADAAKLDPLLDAVDAEAPALLHRPRLETAQIGPGLRLGDRRGRHPLAREEAGQPARLLLGRAEIVDRARRHDLAEDHRPLGQRFEQQPIIDVAEAGAAQILGNRAAEISQRLQGAIDAAPRLGAELAARRQSRDERRDMAGYRLAGALLKLALLPARREIHRLSAPRSAAGVSP